MMIQKKRPLTFLAGFAVLIFIASQPAMAEAEPASCPDDMEQQLYDMQGRIERGEQREVDPVIDLARLSVESCPGRADAQAMASYLLRIAVQSVPDTDRISDLLTLLHTAISQNDIAANKGTETLKVRTPSGEMVNYFGYGYATAALTDTLIPALIALGQRDVVHPLISGAPLEACPYATSRFGGGSSRLMDELKLWSRATDGQEGKPVHTWAQNRLEALRAACPDFAVETNYALARLYGTVAVRMTDWRMDFQETYYGPSEHVYSLPAMTKKELDKKEYEAAKADYDERARPYAAKTKMHLDAYRAALRAIEDYDERSNRVDRLSYTPFEGASVMIDSWEKAIESVEQP